MVLCFVRTGTLSQTILDQTEALFVSGVGRLALFWMLKSCRELILCFISEHSQNLLPLLKITVRLSQISDVGLFLNSRRGRETRLDLCRKSQMRLAKLD